MIPINKRALKRLAAPFIIGFGVISGGVAFVSDLGSFQQVGCQVPGLNSLCGAAGWGGVASAEQDKAWAKAIARQDGDGLRDYLRRWPKGAYAEEAQARLAGCAPREVETWTPETKRLPMYVGLGPNPSRDETAARAEAMSRAERDGQGLCVAFSSGEFRLASVTPEPERWNCQSGGAGRTCGFEGKVACNVEVRRVDLREICRP